MVMLDYRRIKKEHEGKFMALLRGLDKDFVVSVLWNFLAGWEKISSIIDLMWFLNVMIS